jgi:hypothetical protein
MVPDWTGQGGVSGALKLSCVLFNSVTSLAFSCLGGTVAGNEAPPPGGGINMRGGAKHPNRNLGAPFRSFNASFRSFSMRGEWTWGRFAGVGGEVSKGGVSDPRFKCTGVAAVKEFAFDFGVKGGGGLTFEGSIFQWFGSVSGIEGVGQVVPGGVSSEVTKEPVLRNGNSGCRGTGSKTDKCFSALELVPLSWDFSASLGGLIRAASQPPLKKERSYT